MSHRETCSNNQMQRHTDQDLAHMIRSGNLSHAAARYELKMRGKESLIAQADRKPWENGRG